MCFQTMLGTSLRFPSQSALTWKQVPLIASGGTSFSESAHKAAASMACPLNASAAGSSYQPHSHPLSPNSRWADRAGCLRLAGRQAGRPATSTPFLTLVVKQPPYPGEKDSHAQAAPGQLRTPPGGSPLPPGLCPGRLSLGPSPLREPSRCEEEDTDGEAKGGAGPASPRLPWESSWSPAATPPRAPRRPSRTSPPALPQLRLPSFLPRSSCSSFALLGLSAPRQAREPAEKEN